MKLQELRIGSYVYINDSIKQLNRKSFEYAVCKDVCKDLKPIILDDEIILKCEFKFDSKKDFYWKTFIDENQYIELWFNHELYNYDVYLTNYDMEDNNFFGVDIDPIFIKSINSLHQLQNIIFVLSGKEIKFKP